MKKVRLFAMLYLAFQAAAVIGWWVILLIRPEARSAFQIENGSQMSLLAFWLPDLLLVAGGSAASALLIYYRSKYQVASVWLLVGAISYATVYTFAFTLMSDRGWLGVALMLPATLWTGVSAIGVTVGNDMFREAKATTTGYVLLKTHVQVLVVWGMILAVFPYLITLLEDKLGIARLEFSNQRPVAVALFAAVSAIGLWSAQSMSRIGQGTPLPLDHASRLVVVGPYSFVRNPMALSGILQGLSVALFLGSPLVVIYALMGSAIWQFIFRPLEEDDLATRFGDSYTRYRQSVRCWIPHRRRYQIDSTDASSSSITSPVGRM